MCFHSKLLCFICCINQSGNCDCGLFAVAFATAVAYGLNPGQCLFDQHKMREHLHQCLVKQRLTPFPSREREFGNTAGIAHRDDIEVHCHCRMPEMMDVVMTECSKCGQWFHAACENVPDSALNDLEAEWFCSHCK